VLSAALFVMLQVVVLSRRVALAEVLQQYISQQMHMLPPTRYLLSPLSRCTAG
jgi:hypothetical protein